MTFGTMKRENCFLENTLKNIWEIEIKLQAALGWVKYKQFR